MYPFCIIFGIVRFKCVVCCAWSGDVKMREDVGEAAALRDADWMYRVCT